MSRRIEGLCADQVSESALGTCTSCVHWQLGPVSRNLPDLQEAGQRAARKADWITTVQREWGRCGSLAKVDDEVVGHVLWAPADYVRASASYASGPASPDAVVMAGLFVRPDHRGGGIGRQLVRSMAKELIHRRDVRAVEAFAGSDPCLTDPGFLAAVGFATYRRHPRYPRMRLDLRSTISIREELEQALDRLLRPLPGHFVGPLPDPRLLSPVRDSVPEGRP